ncbi:hypothetical protein [Ramlibacter algicola]|uniref:Uncharacterized protein n=1 Tax=Ramlibacter algicola TaxID=2795217 RepID=A0A934PXJ5_9BURK|nr:hypothetical protein [Ramlibacter algicola]MBK0392329.1 hypothetical protein [Ramlibacter algicola]
MITLVVVGGLAAGVAYGMFAVGTMEQLEKSKMYFAAAVLAFLAFIFMLAMIFYALGPLPTDGTTEPAGRAIFDACVKVIPPLATLIIGFYFGASQIGAAPSQAAAAVQSSAPTGR